MRNANCTACPLHRTATTVCIPGDGPRDADILIVGQNPGREEDRRGKPFIGPSGRVLKGQLAKAGLSDAKIRFTNVVRCLTPNNREPTAKEIKACRPYLDAELLQIQPKYVVPVGAPATKAIAKAKITTAHGQMIEQGDSIVMPTYHPAATFRDPSKLTVIQQDFGRLKRHMEGTLGATQEAFKHTVVTDRNLLKKFFAAFDEADEYAYDTETNGLILAAPHFLLRCIAFAFNSRSWVIPLEMPGSFYYGDHNAQAAFFRVVARKAASKWAAVFHGKFDFRAVRRAFGVSLPYHFDAMLAHYVLDENQDHDLKYVARTELDCPEYDLPDELKISDKPEWLERMKDPANRAKYWEYNARDAWNTLHLVPVLSKRLKRSKKLVRLYNELVMPSSHALGAIEAEGLPLDHDNYAEVEALVEKKRDASEARLNKAAGRIVNWNSPKQISGVLFEDLGLPVMAKTPGGDPSTSEAAIVDLKGKHPIINELLEYREHDKVLGTYLRGWKKKGYVIGDRLFVSYKQTGTVTGRYSSPLHSIPTDSSIRSIVALPDDDEWEFFAADLSQAELRIAAEMSGDASLIDAYRNGRDVHWDTLMFMLASGRTDAEDLALETVHEYCVQHEVPPNRAGCEVLQAVWEAHKERELTEELLCASRSSWANPAAGGRFGGRTDRFKQSLLERRDISAVFTRLEEKTLRALQQYQILSSTSSKSRSNRQQTLQLSDAMSLLSCLTPSVAQKLRPEWKDWRTKSKRVGFGYLYGMFENTFIEKAKVDYDWDCTWKQAHSFRQGFFEQRSGLEPWHNRCKRIARTDGYVTNLFGRVRRLPAIQSSDKLARMEAERQAVNAPVQGTIGDWKAAAMVEIHETIDPDQLRLAGEHHDALLGRVRKACRDEALPQMRRIMERPRLLKRFNINMKVPMVADINLGAWGKGVTYHDPT